MIHRHRVVGIVALTALSSLGIASACGVDGSIEGASSGAGGTTSGTAGTSGTSGSAGTSGTSGSAGTSGTSGTDAASGMEVVRLAESTNLAAVAVGGGLVVFAEQDGLHFCDAKTDCTATAQASDAPGGAATAVTFFGSKFVAMLGNQLVRCTPTTTGGGAKLSCNEGIASDASFSGATHLRVDSKNMAWLSSLSAVLWVADPPNLPAIEIAAGFTFTALDVVGDRAVFTIAGTSGIARKLDGLSSSAPGGNPQGMNVTITGALPDPNAVALDGNTVYIVARGQATIADGFVQRCSAEGNGCLSGSAKPLQGLAQPAGIALDGTSIFVTEAGRGQVVSVPKAGGTVRTIATGLVNPTDVVEGAGFVWVTATYAGKKQLYRVKKAS